MSDTPVTGANPAKARDPDLVLEQLPFHREVLVYLKAGEAEQWAWYSSAAFLEEYASATRLDLLKSCYRFDPADHAELYAIVGR